MRTPNAKDWKKKFVIHLVLSQKLQAMFNLLLSIHAPMWNCLWKIKNAKTNTGMFRYTFKTAWCLRSPCLRVLYKTALNHVVRNPLCIFIDLYTCIGISTTVVKRIEQWAFPRTQTCLKPGQAQPVTFFSLSWGTACSFRKTRRAGYSGRKQNTIHREMRPNCSICRSKNNTLFSTVFHQNFKTSRKKSWPRKNVIPDHCRRRSRTRLSSIPIPAERSWRSIEVLTSTAAFSGRSRA